MINWYKFLTEQVSEKKHYLSVRQIDGLFKVFHLSESVLGDSNESGGFEFTPRVPKSPLFGEDNFTKRISLAPNVNRAIYALDTVTAKHQKEKPHAIYRTYYIYAGDLKSDPSDDIDTIKLNVEMKRCNKDLSYVDPAGYKRKYSNFQHKVGVSAKPWDFFGFIGSIREKEFGVFDCGQLSDLEKRRKCLDLGTKTTGGPKSLGDLGREDLKQKFYACVGDALETREEWATEPVTLYYIGKLDLKNQRVEVNEDSLNLIKSKLRKGRIKSKEIEND
jgi:hypothetical protein